MKTRRIMETSALTAQAEERKEEEEEKEEEFGPKGICVAFARLEGGKEKEGEEEERERETAPGKRAVKKCCLPARPATQCPKPVLSTVLFPAMPTAAFVP